MKEHADKNDTEAYKHARREIYHNIKGAMYEQVNHYHDEMMHAAGAWSTKSLWRSVAKFIEKGTATAINLVDNDKKKNEAMVSSISKRWKLRRVGKTSNSKPTATPPHKASSTTPLT